MLKIKDKAGKTIGILKDEDNEPKLESCKCACPCNKEEKEEECDHKDCKCKKEKQ